MQTSIKHINPPKNRKRIEKLKEIKIDDKIEFLKPLGFFDYIKLQQNSKCVISDSGTISEGLNSWISSNYDQSCS